MNQDTADAPSRDGVLAPNLTTWQNEPTVAQLKQDLEAARPSHQRMVARIDRWNDILNARGDYAPPIVKGRSKVQPKVARRCAEWRYSALTEALNSSKDMFDCQPRSAADTAAALQNKIIVNWQFDTQINRVSFTDQYVRNCVDDGVVIVQLGWFRQTRKETVQAPVYAHYLPEQESDVDDLMAANQVHGTPDYDAVPEPVRVAHEHLLKTNQVTVARQTGTQPVENERVIANRPILGTVNPRNFWYDPSCGDDFERAKFAIRSFETSYADLLKEGDRYKNLEFVNWDGSSPYADPDHVAESKGDNTFNFADKARKRVVAYEYYGEWDAHKTGQMVPFVATWIGDVKIRCEGNPFPDERPPYVMVPYMPIKHEPVGEPDAELLGDGQQIVGAVTRGMIDLLGRSANSQIGFAKGMLDVLNRRRFEEGKDYEFNPNLTPQVGIYQHTYPEFPASAMNMLQLMNEEGEALTGVKSFAGGISGEAYGDVATAARGAMDAAAKREMAILRRLAQGMVRIGRKLCAMNGQFLSESETVRVTDEQFVQVSREDLKGEFDLRVDLSTPEVDNAKAQDLGFVLQTMGDSIPFELKQIVLVEIAQLKRQPELAQKLKAYKPQPDPMAVQKAQLEIQKLQMEIQVLQSEGGLNNAKAEKTMVEADHIDLNITEQETGTAQARKVELQGAQGKANQSLEVTKALLKARKKDESKPDFAAAAGWNAVTARQGDPRPDPTPPPVVAPPPQQMPIQ